MNRWEILGLVVSALSLVAALIALQGPKRLAVGCLVVLALLGWELTFGLIDFVSTAAGRDARSLTDTWRVADHADFSDPSKAPTPNTPDQYGQASGVFKNGHMIITLDSFRSATQRYAQHIVRVNDFYATVQVEKLEGPSDGYCGLMFRELDHDHWYIFKVREHQFAITQDDQNSDSHAWSGPTDTHVLGGVNTLAILSQGETVTFFINDHRVDQLQIPTQRGQVELAVEAPAEASSLQCSFAEFVVKVPSTK